MDFTNLLVLAFVVEIITNIFKTFIPQLKEKGWIPTAAAVIGAALCWITATGFLNEAGLEVSAPWLDYIITGIVLSRGAGVVNDLSKYLAKK